MRRALAVSRASRASIKVRIHAGATRIHELEEYMGLLRTKQAILVNREIAANEHIGHVRDVLDQSGITEFSQSDDEEDNSESYQHAFLTDKAHYPPVSDLPAFDDGDSSDSDSYEYPITTSPMSAGAYACDGATGDSRPKDVSVLWDGPQISSNLSGSGSGSAKHA